MESTRSTFQTSSATLKIIFFDGECVLCNFWASFLIGILRRRKNDSMKPAFQLAALQGKVARELFTSISQTDFITPPYRSVVFYERIAGTVNEFKLHTESEAIHRAFSILEFPWSVFSIFRVIPLGVRDGLYRFIARRRYSIFGKRPTCRIPQPEERAWFLE